MNRPPYRPEDWGDRALAWVRSLDGEKKKEIVRLLDPSSQAGQAWAVLCYEAAQPTREEAQRETFETEGKQAMRDIWNWATGKDGKLATGIFALRRAREARSFSITMSDVSRKEFEEMKKDLGSAYRRLGNIKEEMKESLGYVRQTMEIGLTAFAVSWALAKWGGAECSVTLVGVPVELGGALVLKGIAFSGLLDGYAGDAHNIGDGLLSVYLTKKGLQMGSKSAGRGGNISVAGAVPQLGTGVYGQTDAQLAQAMAALQVSRPAGLVATVGGLKANQNQGKNQ